MMILRRLPLDLAHEINVPKIYYHSSCSIIMVENLRSKRHHKPAYYNARAFVLHMHVIESCWNPKDVPTQTSFGVGVIQQTQDPCIPSSISLALILNIPPCGLLTHVNKELSQRYMYTL